MNERRSGRLPDWQNAQQSILSSGISVPYFVV